MLDIEEYRKFYSGGPAAALFLREPKPYGALSDVLLGKRPPCFRPFYSLIPGWSLHTGVTNMSVNSSTDCFLNDVFADLLSRQGLKEKFEEIEPENIDISSQNITSNPFYISGSMNMELACLLIRDEKPIVKEKIEEFNSIMEDFCIRDVVDFESPEVWHYLETILQLISTKQYMSRKRMYDVNVTIYDFANTMELLESGINVSLEENAEFFGFDLIGSEMTNITYSSENSKRVYFMMKLNFSKPHNGIDFSSGSFR